VGGRSVARRPGRRNPVTDTDVALLRSLEQEPSVVAASRRVGISRDSAVYRLQRLERVFGGPVVVSVRGGLGHGNSRLTELGDRIVRHGFDAVEQLDTHPMAPLSSPNVLHGIYHRAPGPEVVVGRALRLRVAFDAEEGEQVSVLLDPEAILIARHRFPTSARNVLAGRVESIVPAAPQELLLTVRVGPARIRVALTAEPVRQLALRSGVRVVLYVKATALRRVGPRARP
jgi:molybdate transport repressor ModE-like protein/molybdopterin-binding protein